MAESPMIDGKRVQTADRDIVLILMPVGRLCSVTLLDQRNSEREGLESRLQAALFLQSRVAKGRPPKGGTPNEKHPMVNPLHQRNSERQEFGVYADFLPDGDTLKEEPPAAKPP